jgi:hypothetical protein
MLSPKLRIGVADGDVSVHVNGFGGGTRKCGYRPWAASEMLGTSSGIFPYIIGRMRWQSKHCCSFIRMNQRRQQRLWRRPSCNPTYIEDMVLSFAHIRTATEVSSNNPHLRSPRPKDVAMV